MDEKMDITYQENEMNAMAKDKSIDMINKHRYEKNLEMWSRNIKVISVIMILSLAFNWYSIFTSSGTYPFIGIKPSYFNNFNKCNKSYLMIFICFIMDILSSLTVIIVCICGIFINGKIRFTMIHWRITLISLMIYFASILVKMAAITFIYLGFKYCEENSKHDSHTKHMDLEFLTVVMLISISCLLIVSVGCCGGVIICSSRMKSYYMSLLIRARKAKIAKQPGSKRGNK